MWWLKKKGWLKPGSAYCSTVAWRHGGNESSIGLEVLLADVDKHARFIYTQTDPEGNKKDFDYKVPLTTTPCNFGGWRYWFECLFCQRRVGVLYKRGDYFACRHCQYLTYESRNLSGRWKWAGKIISAPEIDALREQVKRPFYNGKITRKFKRYLVKRQKFLRVWSRNVKALQEMRLKSNQKTFDLMRKDGFSEEEISQIKKDFPL